MRRNLLVCSLLAALAACGGDGGKTVSAIGALIPATAFQGRTQDISISGSGTTWTEAASVDFGPGITVNSVTVASPTALVVNIAVDSQADHAPRDVRVTENATTVMYRGFQVVPSMTMSIRGRTFQGSVVSALFHKHDLEPFDRFQGVKGDYGHIRVVAEPAEGLTLFPLKVEGNVVEVEIQTDVFAPPGERKLKLFNGAPEAAVAYEGMSLTVEPREATPWTGEPLPPQPGEAYETKLYQFTTASGTNFIEMATAIENASWKNAYYLPEDGKFPKGARAEERRVFISDKSTKVFVVYLNTWDVLYPLDYLFPLFAKQSPWAPVSEQESNDTPASAGAPLTLPQGIRGTLSSATDIDVFAIRVGAEDVGKKLVFVLDPELVGAELRVDVLHPDGVTSMEGPVEITFDDPLYGRPFPTPGTYFVRIDGEDFDPTMNGYQALIRFE